MYIFCLQTTQILNKDIISFMIFMIFSSLEIEYTKRLTVMLFLFLHSYYIKKTRTITTKKTPQKWKRSKTLTVKVIASFL
jgi:hypothetical protein